MREIQLNELPDFSKARVLVVGDVMLDTYWQGAASRISPEAPVPIVHIGEEKQRAGGAGNVALNLAALGCDVSLIGVIGDDQAGEVLSQILREKGVKANLLSLPGVKTVRKLRVISQHQQLIRLDFEDGFPALDESRILAEFSHHLNDFPVVVFSDYGKGSLTAVADMLRVCREKGKISLVDPKGLDFERYRGASVITPNQKEFEAVAGATDQESAFLARGEALRKQLDLTALLVTRGEHGMSLIEGEGASKHFPSRAQEVFDVTGAGDTVIAFLSAGLAAGASMEDATRIANMAAGISVSKLGAVAVTVEDLHAEIQPDHSSTSGIVPDEDRLMDLVIRAKANGERIAFTNGCFDLLHAGHIEYINAAAGLADRLIVAVNDDDSVRRLKGEGRPVSTLENRMRALAGVRGVDWVTSFSEDTPERLINRILPDVLIKGGDYRAEEVLGGPAVIKNGGEVVILNHRAGCSTTQIIRKIEQATSD